MKILLAEDEPILAELYQFLLERAGFEVDCQRDGADVLKSISDQKYQLILLDYMMPKLNGHQVLARLSKQRSVDLSKVVLLTNIVEKKVFNQLSCYHLRGTMIKSEFNPSQFVAAVKKFASIS